MTAELERPSRAVPAGGKRPTHYTTDDEVEGTTL